MATQFTPATLQRLSAALKLPPMTTDVVISIPAGGLAQMTVTRLLDQEELDALAEWYVTENLEALPTGETTYSLEPREVQS